MDKVDINDARSMYFSPIRSDDKFKVIKVKSVDKRKVNRTNANAQVLKAILLNPGVCVTGLAKVTGKCSDTINRAISELVRSKDIVKNKCKGNLIALYAK